MGVEDFILKPAGMHRLRESIGNVIDKLEHDKEENNRKTALLERMDSVRPILERDCVYTLTADRKSFVTAEDFRFLDFEVRAGVCMMVNSKGSLQALHNKLKQALVRIGVYCIGEVIEERVVLFALFETAPETVYIKHLTDFVLQQIRQQPGGCSTHVGFSGHCPVHGCAAGFVCAGGLGAARSDGAGERKPAPFTGRIRWTIGHRKLNRP